MNEKVPWEMVSFFIQKVGHSTLLSSFVERFFFTNYVKYDIIFLT